MSRLILPPCSPQALDVRGGESSMTISARAARSGGSSLFRDSDLYSNLHPESVYPATTLFTHSRSEHRNAPSGKRSEWLRIGGAWKSDRTDVGKR